MAELPETVSPSMLLKQLFYFANKMTVEQVSAWTGDVIEGGFYARDRGAVGRLQTAFRRILLSFMKMQKPSKLGGGRQTKGTHRQTATRKIDCQRQERER